jgi:hypothetical protein
VVLNLAVWFDLHVIFPGKLMPVHDPESGDRVLKPILDFAQGRFEILGY